MITCLDDDSHERLWRICDALVSASGARAAMVCDAASGSVLVSVGDTTASGRVSAIESLGPGERLVHGDAGQVYGVDVPGGALLAVLHDAGALDPVRAAAAKAVADTADLIAHLPPPPPPPAWPPLPHDAHGHVIKSPKPKPAAKKKLAPKTKRAPAKGARPKTKTKTGTRPRTRARAGTRPRARTRRPRD